MYSTTKMVLNIILKLDKTNIKSNFTELIYISNSSSKTSSSSSSSKTSSSSSMYYTYIVDQVLCLSISKYHKGSLVAPHRQSAGPMSTERWHMHIDAFDRISLSSYLIGRCAPAADRTRSEGI